MTDQLAIPTIADLERILDEHPEIRERLRRKLLTDEERELPRVVERLAEQMRQMAQTMTEGFARIDAQFELVYARIERLEESHQRLEEGQQRLESRIERLEEGQQRLEESHQRLEEGQQRLESRIERLEESHQRLEESHQRLEEGQQRLESRTGRLEESYKNLTGMVMELIADKRLRPRITQTLGLRRPKLVKNPSRELPDELFDALDEAEQQGIIGENMAEAVELADLIISAVVKEDGRPAFVLVEISGVIHQNDIQRAKERAEALQAATGQPVFAVAAGMELPDPQIQQAQESGVTLFELR